MLSIRPTDRVLEIGSGNRPRKRSNVLCDREVTDNTERAGGQNLVIDERPFIVADGQQLPFREKSFDYVITSHILEHVEDPRRFTNELMRVARAGYIETPSEISELLFGWPFHRWIVRLDGNTLVLRRRAADSPFGEYFHNAYARDLLFAEFIDTHVDEFYVRYEWHDTISLRIEEGNDRSVRLNRGVQKISTVTPLRMAGVSVILVAVRMLLRIVRHLRKFR